MTGPYARELERSHMRAMKRDYRMVDAAEHALDLVLTALANLDLDASPGPPRARSEDALGGIVIK